MKYLPPSEWYGIADKKLTEEGRIRLRLEAIYYAIFGSASGNGSYLVETFTTIAEQDTYTLAALVGKSILNVFTDGILRATDTYTFDSETGEIILIGDISGDVLVTVNYIANGITNYEFYTSEGQTAYTIPQLVGKTIIQLWSDGILRPSSDYSLNSSTGELTLTGDISEGVHISINIKQSLF